MSLKRKDRYRVAVVGATGAVGREMVEILEERKFPVDELRLLASERSKGEGITFHGKEYEVGVLTDASLAGIDFALFSAGADVSRRFAPVAVKQGAIVIDNSSAFRMEPSVPLVVPEVNPDALTRHQGLIANPNCSTIQMVVALKPLHDAARIRRIVVTTFQSVSGTGKEAMDELLAQSKALLNFQEVERKIYPHQIAFNCLPHIDDFTDEGDSKEELKMVNETRKIMEDQTIRVTATTVRVPVFRGHSESVNLETERPLSAREARAVLSTAPGVIVLDDPKRAVYPLPLEAAGQDAVYVGRIREDRSVEHGLNLWIVSDNLRKGAALNAIQIAEELIKGARVQ
ncbi:MAG TPA: aspartate-semialdehyde dehydrogenase [Nitrospiria bacterium]|nr:aspartate-semialdehyde dehydrogenase [Nitrospiria bacterium]